MKRQKAAHSRRQIPAVEKVVQTLGPLDLPRRSVVEIVRRELAAIRKAREIPEFELVMDRVKIAVEGLRAGRIRPVINATGILIHTNLGRAPLGGEILESLKQVAGQYSNLEYDLSSGGRGSRAGYLEHNLAILCGAQSATVVNNCAAALVLILRQFTRTKKEVVISRGELIQIGGGFRIPEILEASGARLREVGTTNRTSIKDYQKAINKDTGLILTVHRSNFFMDGFVESPSIETVAALARSKRVPFAHDLGSGALLSTRKWTGGEHEPTPAEVLRCGADLVCFSGDKLMGGPQAGVIAGRARWIRSVKTDPFFRALRCDKLILAGLQATVDLYLTDPGRIAVIEMLNSSSEEMNRRAEQILNRLKDLPAALALGVGEGRFGGGTMPKAALPSVTIEVRPRGMPLAELAERLRRGEPPVVGHISGGRLKLDLRTVLPAQDEDLATVLRGALER